MADRPDLPYVSPFILDRWGILKPAQREFFIEVNRKGAALAAAKATKYAADMEKKAESQSRAVTERRRSVMARRLYKWLDGNGRKLPSNEVGIAKHKAMVAEYEQVFGPTSTDYQSTYDSVREGLALDEQRRIEAERVLREHEERRRREAVEVAARVAKQRAARDRAKVVKSAESAVRRYQKSIPSYRQRIERYDARIVRLQARIDDLTPKLESDTYQKPRHQRQLLEVLNNAHKWRDRFLDTRNRYAVKLDHAEEQLSFAYQALDPV